MYLLSARVRECNTSHVYREVLAGENLKNLSPTVLRNKFLSVQAIRFSISCPYLHDLCYFESQGGTNSLALVKDVSLMSTASFSLPFCLESCLPCDYAAGPATGCFALIMLVENKILPKSSI